MIDTGRGHNHIPRFSSTHQALIVVNMSTTVCCFVTDNDEKFPLKNIEWSIEWHALFLLCTQGMAVRNVYGLKLSMAKLFTHNK